MNAQDTTQPNNPVPDAPKQKLVVYNYKFDPKLTCNKIDMPLGSKILHVHGCVIWALVDPDATSETRNIFCISTGTEIDDSVFPKNLKFIASTPALGSVYHLFEEEVQPTLQLTPELKRWLLNKVQKELSSAMSSHIASSAVAALGGYDSIGAISKKDSEIEMLEALEEQLC